MCDILSAKPSFWIAAAESPPPMIEIASLSAIAVATAIVPDAKFAHSETPIGPFQITVPASLTASAKIACVLGPISRPIQPSGILSESTTIASVSAAYSLPTLLSTGIRNLTPFSSAFFIISAASSILSASRSDVPIS